MAGYYKHDTMHFTISESLRMEDEDEVSGVEQITEVCGTDHDMVHTMHICLEHTQ